MAGDADLIVIGGGAAGLAAARHAVACGARALLVSAGDIGGDCTFTGCVPSKALIAAAGHRLAYAEVRTRITGSIARIAATEDEAALIAEGIDVRRAHARLRGNRQVDIDGVTHTARAIVIATGSRPVTPPIPGLAEVAPLTNETVFDMHDPPRRLAVVGGGPMGCELAQAFARLGVAVTLVEMLPRVLAREEPGASAVIAEALAADGVTLRLGARIVSVAGSPEHARLALASGESLEVDRVLLAAGRAPVTDGLDLERAGVERDERGSIRTDRHLATSATGIYAAGDVTGILPFTHAADEMGRIAAGNALGRRRRRRVSTAAIPWVTFTDPEVARVGLTEHEAAARRGSRVAHLPMSEVDRAIVADETRGFVTLIAGPRGVLGHLGGGRIIGATVVASRGGEMIHEPAIAIRTGMFAGRLAQTVHAYPTWSVAMRSAAAQLVTRVGGRTARPARRTDPS